MKPFTSVLAKGALTALVLTLGVRTGWAADAVKAPKGRSPKAVFESRLPKTAPHKLSDIYKIFTDAVRQGLNADVKASAVRVQGQSWELLRDASFHEVELTLKPFETQGLRFDKGGFLFRRMDVDKADLWAWNLHVTQVREVQSRLVFSLRSLARQLGTLGQGEVHVDADMENQRVDLSGQGSFCGMACPVEAHCRFVWDENAKTLSLVPVEQFFGGHKVPSWLWGLGKGPVPKAPVLNFGFSWIPFNIQEVHVGWDDVDLSTDW